MINCAGLHCDRVAELAGERRDMRIVPFRGEYYKIRPERQRLVRNLIYPVPDPKFPFLGVHFTRLIHGGIEAGPNAVLAFAREGYRKTDINLRDLFDALTYRRLLEVPAALSRRCAGTNCGGRSAANSSAVPCSAWCRRSSRTISQPAAAACAPRRSPRKANSCRISLSRGPTRCTCSMRPARRHRVAGHRSEILEMITEAIGASAVR